MALRESISLKGPGFTLISRIPDIVARGIPNALDKTLEEGAEAIAEGARRNVPVSDEPPHIRDDIRVAEGEGFVWFVIAGDDDTPYGHIIEYGGVENDYPAQPFLIPAAEAEKDNITANAMKELGDV